MMGYHKRILNYTKALVTGTLEFEFERMSYRLEKISHARLSNLFRAEINCLRANPLQPGYPWQLQIEPSSACNLKCTSCPAGQADASNPRRVMPFRMLKSLIDEVGSHALIAVFWMWGEPFANSKLPDMIAYAHGKNIGTVTSTNGNLMQTREDAERVVASGLDNLYVAVDGARQETYEEFRKGGELHLVLNCLNLIREAKDSLGSKTPLVNVRTVVTKYNEHELPEIELLARLHGADVVSRKTACAMGRSPDNVDEFAPESARYRRYRYKDGKRVEMPAVNYRCRRIWKRLTLTSDGVLLPCEFDSDRTSPLGQWREGMSFMDIWNGERAKAFREQFIKDRFVNRFCVDCPYRDRIKTECTIEVTRLTK